MMAYYPLMEKVQEYSGGNWELIYVDHRRGPQKTLIRVSSGHEYKALRWASVGVPVCNLHVT